ncbi:unnamed protein product, partial [Rotaria magnacalcarata]
DYPYIEDRWDNLYSEKANKIYLSNKSSIIQQYDDGPHTSAEAKGLYSVVIKRNQKQHQTSSSSITTTAKQSTQLAAKRVRVE